MWMTRASRISQDSLTRFWFGQDQGLDGLPEDVTTVTWESLGILLEHINQTDRQALLTQAGANFTQLYYERSLKLF